MKHCLRFTLFFFWLLTLLICSISSQCQDLSELYQKLKPSVVLVLAYTGNTISQGSGFIISDKGDIITNYHVINGAISAQIRFSNGNALEVEGIVAKDEDADLVRLSVESEDKTFQVLTLCDSVQVGEHIAVIGNPLWREFGIRNVLSEGIVSQVTDARTLISADLSPGSSGSPVFNLQGQVVGVATEISKKGRLYFAIPASKIRNLELDMPVFLATEKAAKDTVWGNSKEGHYTLGKTYLENEYYEEALVEFNEALKKEKDAEIYVLLGICYQELDSIDEAIRIYNEAISIKSDYFAAWWALAYLYQEQECYQEAIQAYKQALILKPDDFKTLDNLASCYSSIKKYEQAREVLMNAIAFYPDSTRVHKRLVTTYINLGRDADVEREFQIVISLDSTDEWVALDKVAKKIKKQGRDQDALMFLMRVLKDWKPLEFITLRVKLLERIEELEPLPLPELDWFEWASLEESFALTSFEFALLFYKYALELNPALTVVNSGIGRICRALRCYPEELPKDTCTISITESDTIKLDLINCTFELHPPLSLSLDTTRAFRCYRQGDTCVMDAMNSCRYAVSYYLRALEDDSALADVWFNLGRLYLILDDFKEALDAYAKLKTIDEACGRQLFHLIYPP